MTTAEYRTARKPLLASARAARKAGHHARTMTQTAKHLRSLWTAQRDLLTARARYFGHSYDLSWIDSQLETRS